MTAALRRESDCCCNLLRCSFRSLNREMWHEKNHRLQERKYQVFTCWKREYLATDPTKFNCRMLDNKRNQRDYPHRGTSHLDSLQARAWSCKRYHIFLHRTHPPEARIWQRRACRNSAFTLRQLGYWHCVARHSVACTRRSSIFLSCKFLTMKTLFQRSFGS